MEGSEDEKERQWAANILPLRESGNLLLSSIVFGNTVANCVTTLLISDLCESITNFYLNTFLSVVIPTATITLLGEMVPQAVCSIHGLYIGSQTRYLTIFFIVLFSPISYPISKFLDYIVGEEGRDVFDRKMLRGLIASQRDLIKKQGRQRELDKVTFQVDTTELVLAAIDLPEKRVAEVMTPIDKIFMLSDASIINKELLQTIAAKGRTRIPIYKNTDKQTITAVLNMKDLLPFSKMRSLKINTVAQLWRRSNQFRFVLGSIGLIQLMIEMKKGVHMAIVVNYDPKARDYIVMGLVTVEDVVEEVVGEIIDEKEALIRKSKIPMKSPWKKASR